MATINTTRALSQFDDLVTRGELFYTPSKPIILTDGGLDFDLRVIPSFASKPLPSSTKTAESTQRHRPPPSDGSDIDHSDPLFFVAQILHSHKLILNKFCVYRPQHLLLTLDPTRRQHEPLDWEDVCAAWAVLRALDGDGDGGNDEDANKGQKHYAIYNGGKEGGSSRKHKHMQVLARPRTEDGELELLPYRAGQMECMPVVAFLSPLDSGSLAKLSAEEAGRAVFAVVRKQWNLAREALRQSRRSGNGGCSGEGAAGAEEDEMIPHNVMITQDWVVTVPRRAATVEGRLHGHVVGCQGVLGSVWCAKEEQLEAWKTVGLKNVLKELGIPGKMKYC